MTFEKYIVRKITRKLKKWVTEQIQLHCDFGYTGPPLTVEEFSEKIDGKLGKTAVYNRVKSGAIRKVPKETDAVVLIPRSELKRYYEGKIS